MLEKKLQKALKTINPEFSDRIHPSYQHAKDISKEIKKMSSVNSQRSLYHVKFNKEIEEFKAKKIIDKGELLKATYRE